MLIQNYAEKITGAIDMFLDSDRAGDLRRFVAILSRIGHEILASIAARVEERLSRISVAATALSKKRYYRGATKASDPEANYVDAILELYVTDCVRSIRIKGRPLPTSLKLQG